MAKKAKKTGLNLYEVTFYYHTNGSVLVKASSEEEALKLADGGNIDKEELLEGLQEDDSPDAELIEENVEPDNKDGIVMCNNGVNVGGTSFHGVTIRSTVNKLTKALGKPTNGDGGYKVSFEWNLKIAHEGKEFVVSVYDWKEGRFPNSQDIDFHIGGFCDTEELIAKGYIEKKLAETAPKKVVAKTEVIEMQVIPLN
jgi:hypothetical protein